MQREETLTVHGRSSAASQSDPRQKTNNASPPPAPVSWEEFLAWLDEDIRAEWVDGEIIEMPPVRDEHQFILGFIYRLIMEIVDERQLGAVYLAPFVMHLPSRPSSREPDLCLEPISGCAPARHDRGKKTVTSGVTERG